LVKGLNLAIEPEVKSSSEDPAGPQKKTQLGNDKTLVESI
jgi:hypothetical protein